MYFVLGNVLKIISGMETDVQLYYWFAHIFAKCPLHWAYVKTTIKTKVTDERDSQLVSQVSKWTCHVSSRAMNFLLFTRSFFRIETRAKI